MRAESEFFPPPGFVADDVGRAWDELGPHLVHDAVMAASYRPHDDSVASITRADSVDALRAEGVPYRIFTTAGVSAGPAIPRPAAGVTIAPTALTIAVLCAPTGAERQNKSHRNDPRPKSTSLCPLHRIPPIQRNRRR